MAIRLAAYVYAGLVALALVQPVQAHFQSIYADNYNQPAPAEVPLKLIFWHPFFDGPSVDMPPPEEFYALHRGERIDLMDSVTETVFQGPDGTSVAYDAVLPAQRLGDYVLMLTTGPFRDETAGLVIQQYVKAVINRGGLPTDWDASGKFIDIANIATANLDPIPTEIIPMTKPYNVLAGSTFTGMLLQDGMPVPGWDVEVVYIAANVDMDSSAAGEATVARPPGGYLTVKTDPNGIFTFGIPRAGFWGFGALGSGPDQVTEDGTPLSQDAIIWVEAFDFEAAAPDER
jgi:cobalt/nickel transport protein